MKIKDITKPLSEAEVTLKPMPGAQSVEVDGKVIGTANTPAAATAISDLAKKGEFAAATTDQAAAENQGEADTIEGGGGDVGGDGTDQFINDVRDAEFEKARGFEEQGAEESFLGFGNKSPEEWAKTSPQMAKLLQFREKAKGTQYEAQVNQRIKLLKDRLDMDMGEVGGKGGIPKDPVPPEQFDMRQLKESDDALLKQMRMIAGL